MVLIKSISGIRGTIGGSAGSALTPTDLVKFTIGYSTWVKQHTKNLSPTIVLGRDSRISGLMVNNIVTGTLIANGCNVIDLGQASTPTVEVSIPYYNAQGGIILTASHNPKQWNALKLLNNLGEFISAADGEKVLSLSEEDSSFAEVENLGQIKHEHAALSQHIKSILNLKAVDKSAIEKKNFKVVVDAVNSIGGICIPEILRSLGVKDIIEINCEPNGLFAHNPEPLPQHLEEISKVVVQEKADLGIVVDPDVDRLALICNDGSMFGEEYTLVAIADYILSLSKGNTVSNLSSSRALKDITELHGGHYYASAVGEVNVVTKMKEVKAVIGGEGNGGIIYPELHYGRDALVGVALFLSHLAHSGLSCKQLREKYPEYYISKNKIELTPEVDVDALLLKVKNLYSVYSINDSDGVRIDFENTREWVHLRKSNTEPIIRIYAESQNAESADKLAHDIIREIKSIIV